MKKIKKKKKIEEPKRKETLKQKFKKEIVEWEKKKPKVIYKNPLQLPKWLRKSKEKNRS